VLGLSYKEAARALQVREATLTTRLFRARKQVSERLAPEPRARDDKPGAAGRSTDVSSAGELERAPVPQRPSIAEARREDKDASGVLFTEGAP
jgi:hypothetical protein